MARKGLYLGGSALLLAVVLLVFWGVPRTPRSRY